MSNIILTGCASGIGQHFAEVLLSRGHNVTATDLRLEVLERQAQKRGWDGSRLMLRQLDVRDGERWSTVVGESIERNGRLDVLINVAGYVAPGWIHEQEFFEVARHVDVNLTGVMLGTFAAAREMVRERHGHIVNIASLAGVAPVPGLAVYSGTKFAVRGFSLAAAHELKKHDVAVTVVCPDAVQTPMLDLQLDRSEAELTFSGSRVLRVEDVSAVVLGRVLARRPLEVRIPRTRGWLARMAELFPTLAAVLEPGLRKRGRQSQERLRRNHKLDSGIRP